jgi:hypothetical protein
MAHYAQLDSNNVVLQVIVINDNDMLDNGILSEAKGALFCNSLIPGTWIQTSYNTYGNVHKNGGTPLRKNYACVGYTYNETLDAFIAPKPSPSYILNEETGIWEIIVPEVDGN